MKRTLSVLALTAATLASASVYAQNPQPSFQDSAPVPATQTATNTVIVKQNFPQPSFNDNATVAAVVTQAAEAKPAVAHVSAPLPSFNG
jgi:hypothetical protein